MLIKFTYKEYWLIMTNKDDNVNGYTIFVHYFLKSTQKQEILKRFLKEIYQMWDGWMEALADSTKTRIHM